MAATDNPAGRPTIDFPFSAIPHALLGDERVGGTEIRVYGALVWIAYEEGGGDLQVTHAEIAKRINCSPRSIARPLAKLEELGWIERVSCHSGHGRLADRYHLHSKDADSRAWVEANRADSRGRDHADLRGPTSLKEEERTLALLPAPESSPDTVPAAQIETDFEEWYSAYPRKKKPGTARPAYTNARKKATKDELLNGAVALARLVKAQGGDTTFTPYPASWLNAEQWRDEEPEERNPFEAPPMRYG